MILLYFVLVIMFLLGSSHEFLVQGLQAMRAFRTHEVDCRLDCAGHGNLPATTRTHNFPANSELSSSPQLGRCDGEK